MDVTMPRLDGVEATRALKAAFPEVTGLMLTRAADDDHLFAAIAAGASGYVFKSEPTDTFLHLLEGAARGEVAVTATLAGRLLREFARLHVQDRDEAVAHARRLGLIP